MIQGASEGKGIGTRFLGHVERCSVLLHLVDGTTESVVKEYNMVFDELKKYGGDLVKKPVIVVLNKVDALNDIEKDKKLAELKSAVGSKVCEMSGFTSKGVNGVLRELRLIIDHSKNKNKIEPEIKQWIP